MSGVLNLLTSTRSSIRQSGCHSTPIDFVRRVLRWRRRLVLWRDVWLPLPGGDLTHRFGRGTGQPLEELREVDLGVETCTVAVGDECVECGGAFAASWIAHEQPVF